MDGELTQRTFLSSRLVMAFFIGFSESRAILAGNMSFLSMSLISSIMSVLSSAKASSSLTARSMVSAGVSTCSCRVNSPATGL